MQAASADSRQLYALFETPQLDARLVYCHSNLNHSLTILVVFYYWKQSGAASGVASL